MQTIFEGIWVPIVTPFVGDAIDHLALARLARYLAGQGIAGLVVGATTGEGALLRAGEHAAAFATLRQTCPGLPLVLGIAQADTYAACTQAREFAALGPEGVLVTSPCYVRPSQAGVQRHFEAIAEAADLPILIYNIPYRTAVNIELATLSALARDRRVVGIKECGGSIERMQALLTETPLRVLSGDDSQNFAAHCLGAHGTIAASAHILPALHVRMRTLVRAGQTDAARRIARAFAPLVSCLFAEPNPAPLKAWLAQQGWCEPQLRLPFLPASAALNAELQQAWQRLQAAPPILCDDEDAA